MSFKIDSPISNKKSTPPTKVKVRNPFDKVLIEKLHKPICSPGMCKIYKEQRDGSFRWDIDQACTLLPADIVACNSQFEPSPDPVLEKIAEEANEKFFSQEMVMPSPLETSKKIKPLLGSSSECSSNLIISSFSSEKSILVKDVSVQTLLTLPPELPPEIEKILQPFCTYTQDENMFGEYEITANGSLRRQLFFEEHSDMEHDDSELTDDDIQTEKRRPSSYEAHTRVSVSPDLSQNYAKGSKRTFVTPVSKGGAPCRNKPLELPLSEPEFSPIERRDRAASVSPPPKALSSDEEKNMFTSPESEAMATCLDCAASSAASRRRDACFCVRRSASLKESPRRGARSSFSERRSLSMSSLSRSRSVQKLDFSIDMSLDESHDSRVESEHSQEIQPAWSIEGDTSIHRPVKAESSRARARRQPPTGSSFSNSIDIDETPIKGGKRKTNVSHEISKIRAQPTAGRMSLDSSAEHCDMPLCMERKMDFDKVDLKFLTNSISQMDNATSFKRIDSGFNENTFYTNASGYYESAIRPSELTITDRRNTTALKEISNVNWMRVDSGFRDENSCDSVLYCNEAVNKKSDRFSEAAPPDKENVGYEKFLNQAGEGRSISDTSTTDMSFHCNFSSTPSKTNKSHKVNS